MQPPTGFSFAFIKQLGSGGKILLQTPFFVPVLEMGEGEPKGQWLLWKSRKVKHKCMRFPKKVGEVTHLF